MGGCVLQLRAARCFAWNQRSSDGFGEGNQNALEARLRNLGGNR